MKMSGKTPLLKALEHNRRLKLTPFHMPGHKKGKAIHPKFNRMVHDGLFSMDLTEIPGLDDLHNPSGPIKNAQIRAAQLFGAEHSFFLINGTTAGIHAAILAVCKPGEKLLIPRDVHRSVIGACILSGAKVKYLPFTLDGKFQIPCPPSPNVIAAELERNPDIKAVLFTYPTYYGLAGNLAKIAAIVHKYNIPLLVDEAHGAHFRFSSSLPLTALAAGADVSIQSTHKTLGAFTQASMLHIKSKLVQPEEIARQLRILQSTSPSYLLMASLDAAVGHLETSGKIMVERTVRMAVRMRSALNRIPGIKYMGQELMQNEDTMNFDPTKIYLSAAELGLTGHQAARLLLRQYHLQVELADRDNVLFMISIGNTSEDGRKLISAVQGLAAESPYKTKQTAVKIKIEFPLPEVRLTPRDAWFGRRKSMKFKEAAGTISAEIVAPYPPGVPILCPGEVITPEIISVISCLQKEGASFHGPEDPALNNILVADC